MANVLVVGSGAREHALVWKLRASARVDDLFALPGNPGCGEVATRIDLSDTDLKAVVRTCKAHRIELVVGGNEEPLAAGLVDRLAVEGIAAFGPVQQAAEIEWSKVFAKELMQRHGIPTAPFAVFAEAAAARRYVSAQTGPVVVKADGLARGKGAIVCSSQDDAFDAIEAMLVRGEFGASGRRIVIEERLSGSEVSAHAFTDGRTVRHAPFSCDSKAIFDGDRGPNTGGMGAYTPANWLSQHDKETIQQRITERAVDAMAEEGRPYKGLLYPGVMLTGDGPTTIEFNCRFGDPEAEVLLPTLESDLFEVMWAVANNRLHDVDPHWSDDACVAVFIASGGYPGDYETGLPISGVEDLDDDVQVFHAGTQRREDGTLVTAGGRVLAVVAEGSTIEDAQRKVYANIERIHFDGMQYRRDIGASRVGVT
jgi:phosphoribosylamine--glycine ligase